MKVVNPLILILLILGLTSCGRKAVEPTEVDPGPDPTVFLREQIQEQKQLRVDAEKNLVREVQERRKWELATLIVALLAMIGFFLGIILGSRTRHHAETSSET